MRTAPTASPLAIALQHHQAGRWEEALRTYRQLQLSQPRLYEAWYYAGLLFLQTNRPSEAQLPLQRALQIQPRALEPILHLGLALRALGQFNEALRLHRNATQFHPKAADAWLQLGLTHQASGQRVEAVTAFQKALELRPKHSETLDSLGALIADTQGLTAALPYFKEATVSDPQRASAWCNLGLALNHHRQYPEALQALAKAAELDPRLHKAHSGRALAYLHTYQLEKAIQAFGDALALRADDDEAWSGKLLTLHYLDTVTPERLAAEHIRCGEVLASRQRTEPLARANTAGRKLRVGFLGPDFRRHAVACFALPLLRHLDREAFEVFVYHDHGVHDSVTNAFRETAHHWRDLAGQNHSVVERRLLEDQLDILVDLAGHTGINRIAVLARRVAPVQVTYLGYPNTTGLKTMDFRFTDAIADPEGETEAWHSEKLVRFSSTAWSYEPPTCAPSAECLLNDEGPRLACFNNFAKVSDLTLRLWAKILARRPDATLVLKGQDLDQEDFILQVTERLRKNGLPTDKVQILGRTVSLEDHLATYRRVDVSLDPYPYHGTTSTCEALWMGVPVVTRLGRAHVSRVSASLLNAIGRTEWVAADDEAYVETVLGLLQEGTREAGRRQGLREAMKRSTLLDHASHAQAFGRALRECARARLLA